jgi:hypothetical protein
MIKVISRQDYYNRLEAFYEPDRMIRIAAIHRAGEKMEGNGRLRQIVKDLLSDKDLLVARYAAVTLAQNGDYSGLQYLLQEISCSQGQDREDLNTCLRNCARFPFAVLLNQRLFVETVPNVKDEAYRQVLKNALELTSDTFYEVSESDPSFRPLFLKVMRSLGGVAGLRVRDECFLDDGLILSVPMGKQPGFLFCPNLRLFLKFREESVLNREYVDEGRQVLFVARDTSNGEVECIYVLEDSTPHVPQLSAEAVLGASHQLGLLPGVVVYKSDSPNLAYVLCPTGESFREAYRAQRAFVEQFVLVEKETDMGRSQCHFVHGLRLDATVIRKIVSEYAATNNITIGYVTTIHEDTNPKTGLPRCTVRTEQGEEITSYIPPPSKGFVVLLKKCHVCKAAGNVECDLCKGRGMVPCYGEHSCGRCKGRGKLGDGATCLLCSGSGSRQGCQGNGRVACPVCNGQGELDCDRCGGSGEYQPSRSCPKCSGNGNFRVSCQRCGGSGKYTATCRKCDGSGWFRGGTCWSCDGTGSKTFDCGACDGTGQKTLECTACNGSGYWEAKPCNACDGQGLRECFYCHGDEQIQCPICRGDGQLSCRKCRTTGRVGCPYCQGNRLIFDVKVDCLRS